jgi:hypothetical protein
VVKPDNQRWRQVQGTILRSEVRFTGELYEPIVEYSYEVDGSVHKGFTVKQPLVLFNWRGPAARLVTRFPVGAAAPVFVDPTDPRKAVLLLERDSRQFLLLLATFAVLAVIVLVGWLSKGAS